MDDSRWSALNNTCDGIESGSSITVLIILGFVCLFVITIDAVGVTVVVKVALGWGIVVLGFWYSRRYNDRWWLLFMVLYFICCGWCFCCQLPHNLSIIIYIVSIKHIDG